MLKNRAWLWRILLIELHRPCSWQSFSEVSRTVVEPRRRPGAFLCVGALLPWYFFYGQWCETGGVAKGQGAVSPPICWNLQLVSSLFVWGGSISVFKYKYIMSCLSFNSACKRVTSLSNEIGFILWLIPFSCYLELQIIPHQHFYV